ncbi:MAG: hypothetical protein KIT83_02480 [Bryobacterales bacterium]|nr:hypothetical protein [Bryobacterales bacterium]
MTRRELFQYTGLAGVAASIGCSRKQEYLPLIRTHLEGIAKHGLDRYGAEKTPMWMASLDLETMAYPESEPIARAGRRVYRDIASPFGSNIYWDVPQLAVAHAVSDSTGDPQYSKAVTNYVQSFLAKGVDEHGVFEWGNHRYYDAFTDKPAHFTGGPHEMRPIHPCWEVFWRIDPKVTETQIRQSGIRHVFDPATGGFNRHDDGIKGYAFLEAGGILSESLSWLYAKTKDDSLADMAQKIAEFSFGYRGADTGLVENSPTRDRWDKYVCTTEVGLWAGSLLRAADLTGRQEFERMAEDAMKAYLRYGYDKKTRRYFGQLQVADGKPVLRDNPVPGHEEYFPGNHADVWNANFPSHDYPMAFATTCVELYRRTKAEPFGEAIERWAGALQEQEVPTTASNGRGGYAELFGRSIQFLLNASEVTGGRSYMESASALAMDAKKILYANGMFRGHAGEDRYDAVDGVGFLLLALFSLDTGKRPDYLGFGF